MKRNIFASLIVGFIAIIGLNSGLASAQQTTLSSIYLSRASSERTHNIAWSPDGSLIAWAIDHDIWIYTADLKEEYAHLQGHTDEVFSVAWSPDGTRLISGGSDASLRIWNMEAGANFATLSRILEGHRGQILTVAWSPDGSKIATLAVDYIARSSDRAEAYNATWIWDAVTGEILKKLPAFAGSPALVWSPDSLFLANGGEGPDGPAAYVWDIATETLYYSLGTGVNIPYFNLDWSATGQYLAVVNQSSQTYVVDMNQKNLFLWFAERDYSAQTIDWSPNDATIATGNNAGDIIIWDVQTATPLVYLEEAQNGSVLQVAWSPDGSKLASVGWDDRSLIIWDTSNLPTAQGIPTVTPLYTTATP